jgi:serine O-acetyltransferase
VFSAYGITPDADDPLFQALRGLINHAATQEQQMRNILTALEAAGIPHDNLPPAEKIDTSLLDKLAG